MRTVYWFWSIVVLVMVVLQIAFAGYGAFYAAHKLEDEGSSITDKTFEDGFGIHIGFGYLVWLAVMVLLVIGVIAGVGRWRLGKHGVLALLLTLQILLAWFGGQRARHRRVPSAQRLRDPRPHRSRSCGTAGRREKRLGCGRAGYLARPERMSTRAYSGALPCSPPTRNGVVIPA